MQIKGNLIYLIQSLFIVLSCTSPNKQKIQQVNIKEIILYYEVYNRTESDTKELLMLKPHRYSDIKIFHLFEKAELTKEFFLWKGSIGGLVLYENGDSVKLKISRYGAYFINLKTNESYTFPKAEVKKQWRTFIDSFLNNSS